MAKLIFFSTYPNEKDMQDGFFVRIKNIDNIFLEEERIYLSVSYRHNIRFKINKVTDKLTIIEANAFLHYFKILKILRASGIYYVQSLYNYLWTILFPIKKEKKVIWDVHGVVPEELYFYGKKTHAHLLGVIEYLLARRANLIVSVTKSMYNYLTEKYPKISKNNIIYPVINNSFFIDANQEEVNVLRKELGITSKDIVFIYSGSLIKWQRFDDILKIIKSLDNPNYRFIILTGQIKEALEKITDNNLGEKKIEVRTAKPDELSIYYNLAHYGFVLRDNHIFNHVAAPTKLLEYLYYGLTPIVDYEKIGDFYDLGYEHICINDVSNNMQVCKSQKNTEIINSFFKNNQEGYFRYLVLKK